MWGLFQVPLPKLLRPLFPTPEVSWGLRRKTVLQLEQLRQSRVQQATGPRRQDLEMTSLQNLDCEARCLFLSVAMVPELWHRNSMLAAQL